MRKAENDMYYYTTDDTWAIARGVAMGIYKSGPKMNVEKKYVSVLLSRFKNEEEQAGNFNDDYRKPLLIKNGSSQVGRPRYEFTAYYVDKVLNYLSQNDEDSLDIFLAEKNIIKNNTLTRAVVSKIFKDVLNEKTQLVDSKYDSQMQVINSIYRKDRANRNKLLTKINEMKALRDNNYDRLDKFIHDTKKRMNAAYSYLQDPKIETKEKINMLQDLTSLNRLIFDENTFIKAKLEMLELISKSRFDNESLNKIFNKYKKKNVFTLPNDRKQEIIFQIIEKDFENHERLKVKIIEFEKETIGLLSEKQGQIDMLFSYIDTISDFLNSNIDPLAKLELSSSQLGLWKM